MIGLPSGIQNGAFYVRGDENGSNLVVTIVLPEPFIDVSIMHRQWHRDATMKPYHPCILRFEDALQLLRRNRSDTITSRCFFELPFNVEAPVEEKYN